MQLCTPPLFEQTIREITHACNEQHLLNSLEKAVQLLEFDYFAHGVCVTYPVTRPTFSLRNNYPKSWQERYSNNNYIALDPTVKHGLHSTRPISWKDELMRDQSEFWEEAAAHGLNSGWAQSSILSPSATGMLTVARKNESRKTEELRAIQPLLIWLSNTFGSTYAEIVLPDTLNKVFSKLTSRETEILKWCADGKASVEIAMILNVTKRTVDFHIANTIKKLNVTNKTAAAVRAIQLNLL